MCWGDMWQCVVWEDGGGCVGGNGMMVMCALCGCGVEVRGTMDWQGRCMCIGVGGCGWGRRQWWECWSGWWKRYCWDLYVCVVEVGDLADVGGSWKTRKSAFVVVAILMSSSQQFCLCTLKDTNWKVQRLIWVSDVKGELSRFRFGVIFYVLMI